MNMELLHRLFKTNEENLEGSVKEEENVFHEFLTLFNRKREAVSQLVDWVESGKVVEDDDKEEIVGLLEEILGLIDRLISMENFEEVLLR